MLQNKKTQKIFYETLTEKQKELLRDSCLSYLRDETSDSFCGQLLDMFFSCDCAGLCVSDPDISDAVLDLMEYLTNNKIVTNDNDFNENDYDMLVELLKRNTKINFQELNTKLLRESFKLYIEKHIRDFVPNDILIALILCFTSNDKKKDEYLGRLPFIMSNEYRIFFMKLPAYCAVKDNNCTYEQIASYVIKPPSRNIEIDRELQIIILKSILDSDFKNVSKDYFF